MITPRDHELQTLVDEAWLTLDELCRVGGVSSPWVLERLEAGLLSSVPGALGQPGSWRFDGVALQRVRRMARLERDFDAVPELAALVLDLQTEIERLRAQLRHAGLGAD